MGRLVGLSYDLKQVGIAVSDPTHTIASPLTVIPASKRLEQTARVTLQTIEHAIGESIDQLILGLPLLMNGQIGFLGDEISHFAEALEAEGQHTVLLWDSRLASVQADRAIRGAGASAQRREKQHRSVAAALVLQGYLDHCKIKEKQDDTLLVD